MTFTTVKFEAVECYVTGEIGLALAGHAVHEDYVAITAGFTLAHDLIEHPNGIENIGGVGDELEATGCIWYTRGQHHDMQRPERSIYTPEQACAHEIAENYRHWMNRGCEFDMPVPHTTPCLYDSGIREILKVGARIVKEEHEYDTDEEPNIKYLAEFILAAKHFMRSGIAKQQVRFPHFEHQANNEFWNIQEAVEPHMGDISHVGQTFELVYGDESLARMYETFEYDEDEMEDD